MNGHLLTQRTIEHYMKAQGAGRDLLYVPVH